MFPVVKRLEGLSAEYGIPHKIMSDAGTNFVSDKLQKFCNSINVEQAVSLANHHQSNGQVKACITFKKHTFTKCAKSGGDINMAILQIQITLLGQGLLSLATLMFNRQVWDIMSVLECMPIGKDNDDEHHSKLIDRKNKNNWCFTSVCIPPHRVSCSSPASRWQTMDPWDNSWYGWPQPSWQSIHHTTNHKWQMNYTQ